MKYYLDTEFNEDGVILDLISLAIVSEDDKKIVMYNSSANLKRCNDFVKENVLPYLPGVKVRSHGRVAVDDGIYANKLYFWYPQVLFVPYIMSFFAGDDNPEIWADWGAYDWVAFARCFGQLMDLPPKFPMFVRDFQQLHHMIGRPEIPVKNENEHDVLSDAIFLKNKIEWVEKNYELNYKKIRH